MDEDVKQCSQCREIKPIEEFGLRAAEPPSYGHPKGRPV